MTVLQTVAVALCTSPTCISTCTPVRLTLFCQTYTVFSGTDATYENLIESWYCWRGILACSSHLNRMTLKLRVNQYVTSSRLRFGTTCAVQRVQWLMSYYVRRRNLPNSWDCDFPRLEVIRPFFPPSSTQSVTNLERIVFASSDQLQGTLHTSSQQRQQVHSLLLTNNEHT